MRMPLNPLMLDEKMAEFCGIISGDGNVWTNGRKYEITITGSPRDKDYMDGVAAYVLHNIKPRAYYRLRGKGLRLTVYSWVLFDFIVNNVGLGIGTEKNPDGIPAPILKSRCCTLAFIRGMFDTDGSVFTSMKRGAPDYPAIEITNENVKLLQDIRAVLNSGGFRTTFRKSNSKTYKIAVHGTEMVKRWLGKIGSSHPRKLSKMESIIKTTGQSPAHAAVAQWESTPASFRDCLSNRGCEAEDSR